MRYLISTAVFVASTAFAAAAPPRVLLTPQDASTQCGPTQPCVQPTIDGHIAAAEYSDGRMTPLQDFAKGGPNGTLFMMVTDAPPFASNYCNFGPSPSPTLPASPTNPCVTQRLFLGLRIARPQDEHGKLLQSTGVVRVMLDAKRAETLAAVAGSNAPRGEDRMIELDYNTTTLTGTTKQFQGNGAGWTPLSNLNEFGTDIAWRIEATDPTEIQVEIGITLHPILAFGTGEPLTSKLLGLGVLAQASISSGVSAVPAAGTGSYPDGPTLPSIIAPMTWETLDLENPTPISLSFATWNVGQMSAYHADGGSATPDKIAAEIVNSKKETICLDEVWAEKDREEIVDKVNAELAQSGQVMHAVYEQDDEVLAPPMNSTGLVLLTTHPIVVSAIHHFPENQCEGILSDCLQHKGMIWARLALSTSNPKDPHPVDGRDFVDVFCTHLQAGSSSAVSDEEAVRQVQMKTMMRYIAEVRAGGPLNDPTLTPSDDVTPQGTWLPGSDRPALLMGDFNTAGPIAPPMFMTSDNTDPTAYKIMMSLLGLDTPTEFDLTNSLFSDVRDFNMQVTTGPSPTLSETWLGESDEFHDGVCNVAFNPLQMMSQERLDYTLILPPDDSDQLPTFAISNAPGTQQVSVDAHWDGSPNFTCMSDHAEVDIKFGLVRVSDSLVFNSAKPHKAEFDITDVVDHASGGCCADWYVPDISFTSTLLGTQHVNYDTSDEWEGDEVWPNWNVEQTLPAGFQGSTTATLSLYDSDVFGDDHYDQTPQGGDATNDPSQDLHLNFNAVTGTIAEMFLNSPVKTLGTVFSSLSPDFLFDSTGTNSDGNTATVTYHYSLTEM